MQPSLAARHGQMIDYGCCFSFPSHGQQDLSTQCNAIRYDEEPAYHQLLPACCRLYVLDVMEQQQKMRDRLTPCVLESCEHAMQADFKPGFDRSSWLGLHNVACTRSSPRKSAMAGQSLVEGRAHSLRLSSFPATILDWKILSLWHLLKSYELDKAVSSYPLRNEAGPQAQGQCWKLSGTEAAEALRRSAADEAWRSQTTARWTDRTQQRKPSIL